jgi:hypothetical protein
MAKTKNSIGEGLTTTSRSPPTYLSKTNAQSECEAERISEMSEALSGQRRGEKKVFSQIRWTTRRHYRKCNRNYLHIADALSKFHAYQFVYVKDIYF